ncbi:hypothetical protein BC939DRAFT_450347 [Gamsiella multidivaricata]|uniref:uncharacterized protein n=1 Tax=Gamsiella multidivaricata TaxID=101098 RepID=UPI00221EA33E|nr:uncharacterized protein BC939DRAFT_450347 [Gamsiella multidivaricata]KAI7824038.1 hypothetical protein BC939DRAFT_450347 [Gamsiella multidivaricata]
MSIAPSIAVGANPRDISTTAGTPNLDSSSSPPATPPNKSSGPDAGSAVRSSLPSPPPSSSSKHSRPPPDHQHDHQDQRDPHDRDPTIEKIARRLSPNTTATTTVPTSTDPSSSSSRPYQPRTSTAVENKTHSSSSSTSSSTSVHQLPSMLSNKHVAVTKTKTLGHLTRSTSSEVDNEVANALASGRSIVSKTDWKDEDAQYLSQLIETQFPKGNIIWDWVGQQMVSRGFSKSQCRSKWKRMRTKILHGNDAPIKDKEYKDQHRDHEPDELIEEDEDEPTDQRGGMTDDSRREPKWQHRQEYERPSEGSDYSDSYGSRLYASYTSHSQQGSGNYHYGRDSYTSSSAPPPPPPTHRPSASYSANRHTTERSAIEEDELWSDDDNGGYQNHNMGAKRYSQDYQSREYLQHRRQSSSNQPRDEVQDERSLSAIAATPTNFGKIEWKPEDSDYLVHLIESKFASRKVDWAWVSQQMAGRGYDRTQCKSRWWRVQHRNQASMNSNHLVSTSQPSSRNKHRQSIDQASIDLETNGIADGRNEKHALSDEEGLQGGDQTVSRQGSIAGQERLHIESRPSQPNTNDLTSQRMHSEGLSKERMDDDERLGVIEDRGSSPRPTRTGEHQKHIEWKEEDSQYMYRLIEKEFPVGNVVWSVIGEKMQSRGYSQTQCMSKWRRHLKNNKMLNDSSKGGASMDLDLDPEIASNESRSTGYRRRGPEERHMYNDPHADSAKRFKKDGTELKRYDYNTVDPMDARIVEMEYDRYYDAGGKRRRINTEDSLPPPDSGYAYDYRGHSSAYGDDHVYDRDFERHRHEMHSTTSRRRRHHSQGEDVATAVAATLAVPDSETPSRPSSPVAYTQDEARAYGNSYEAARNFDRGADITGAADERDNLSKSGRDPGEPHTYEEHHNRPTSTVLSSYRNHYNPNHPYLETQGDEHAGRAHSYSRAEEPMVDPNKEVPHKPRLSKQRSSPVGRSSEQGTVGTSLAREHGHSEKIPLEGEDGYRNYDYPAEGRTSNNRTGRESRLSYDYSNNDQDYYINRRSTHSSQRQRQDHERDSGYIDYVMEDDMDWAAGRWEGRDMARLAAAVARQGRRWDALRAQIRIPLLVSPYEDMDDDIYEGVRFDPHPFIYQYHTDDQRRARHHSSRPSISASSAGHTPRQLPSVGLKYKSSRDVHMAPEPLTSDERRAHVSAELHRGSRQPMPQSYRAPRDPTEVDLTREDDGLQSEQARYPPQQHRHAAEDEAVINVASVGDDDEDVAKSELPSKAGVTTSDMDDGAVHLQEEQQDIELLLAGDAAKATDVMDIVNVAEERAREASLEAQTKVPSGLEAVGFEIAMGNEAVKVEGGVQTAKVSGMTAAAL